MHIYLSSNLFIEIQIFLLNKTKQVGLFSFAKEFITKNWCFLVTG